MEKLKFSIANLFWIFIIAEALLHYLIPIKQLITPYNYLGVALFLIGWIPSIWIWAVFKKAGNKIPSPETPNKLITSGLFRISRNPNYLGLLISLIGGAIFFGSLMPFIAPAVFFVLINKFNVSFEEKVLEKKFGKKYLDYKKRVRRWM